MKSKCGKIITINSSCLASMFLIQIKSLELLLRVTQMLCCAKKPQHADLKPSYGK